MFSVGIGFTVVEDTKLFQGFKAGTVQGGVVALSLITVVGAVVVDVVAGVDTVLGSKTDGFGDGISGDAIFSSFFRDFIISRPVGNSDDAVLTS